MKKAAKSESTPSRLVLEIDIRQRVAAVILDDEEGIVRLIDGPRRRKSASLFSADDRQLSGGGHDR
jgi:hypothetical protein